MRLFGRPFETAAEGEPAANMLILYFDGSCGPRNPGGVAIGAFRILDQSGELIHDDAVEECRGPGATNNVAEWAGLWHGLRWLRKYQPKVRRLQIFGDSQLVINQLNGVKGCKKEHLREFRDKCLKLLEGIVWSAAWVGRDENQEADQLARDKYEEIAATRP